jgi:hypothetical protein
VLWKEAHELMLIFSAIFRKLSTKKRPPKADEPPKPR